MEEESGVLSDLKKRKALDELKEYLTSNKISLKDPVSADIVHKDECVYCFDSPFNPDGLFISLKDFVGVCAKHLDQYVQKTGERIFLNVKNFKLPAEESDEPKDKIQRLTQQERIESEHSLRFYPHIHVPIPINTPELHGGGALRLQEVCDSIIAHASAEAQQQLKSGISQWDGEERQVSQAAEHLVQVKYEGQPIPYEGWICSVPDCGIAENLWLNLSDGVICCGRYAVGVQPGNGHAKKHYEDTGYPLVVKLGTIENGDGDIYSYLEDAPVRDPKLREHLAHFGLDIGRFTKTQKTTLEMELDMNMKHEFSAIQEEGATLQNVYGPGFTGLINLGSSCYINSTLQMLYNVPDFRNCFARTDFLAKLHPLVTYEDFNCQLAKLVAAMDSGEYSKEEGELNGIRPTVFRRVAGRGHVEFSTAKQQDAEEYIRHLFDLIDRNCPDGPAQNPVNAFRFQLVTRFEDLQSKCVRYGKEETTILSVPVPRNKWRRSSVVVMGASVPRAVVSLADCIAAAFSEEFIDGYMSPVMKLPGLAKQELRMGSFPDFLLIQIRRFEATNTFEVKKLDLDLEISEELDLTAFHSTGSLQPDEQPLPVQTPPPGKQAGSADPDKVAQLVDFGFSPHQATWALQKNRGETMEALDWLLNHQEEVPPEQSDGEVAQSKAAKEVRDGEGKYRLSAFISHMGSSPHSGHYVAHVRRDNCTWYIFNDEKVAISQNPPLSLGYIYLYERILGGQ